MALKYKADSVDFLKTLDDNSVKVAFFDPQYRGVMDKLNYGNEGERQIERAVLPQMTNEYISRASYYIHKKLAPSGYLFLWVDKFHAHNLHELGIDSGFQLVDSIVWHKQKMGMGYRSRRISEHLMVFQKLPIKAKATWTDHGIPDVWLEKLSTDDRKTHVHRKPKELIKRLIEATSKQGDLIVDPAAGSFLVADICEETSRAFKGSDILTGIEDLT